MAERISRVLAPSARKKAFIVLGADLCRVSVHPTRASAVVAFASTPGALGIVEDFPRFRSPVVDDDA